MDFDNKFNSHIQRMFDNFKNITDSIFYFSIYNLQLNKSIQLEEEANQRHLSNVFALFLSMY